LTGLKIVGKIAVLKGIFNLKLFPKTPCLVRLVDDDFKVNRRKNLNGFQME